MVRAMDAGLNRYMYNNLFDNLNIKICTQRDDLRLVFTSDGVGVGVVIRSVE